MNEQPTDWQLIQRQYGRMVSALIAQDVDAFLNLCTPDYYEINKRGKIENMEQLKANMKSPDFVRLVRVMIPKNEISQVEEQGDHYTVRVTREICLGGKPPIFPKHLRWLARIVLTTNEIVLEQWLKVDNEWKMASSKSLKSSTQLALFWENKQEPQKSL